MIISPYNPLDFGTDKFKDNSSLPSDHQQTWAKADTIWLEVIHDYPISVASPQETIAVKIDNTSVSPHKADISTYNGKYCSVWCIALSAQNTTDTHQVTITETIGSTITTLYSNNFQVLENNHPDIANTLLLAYTNKDNRKTDRHVWINPYTSPISQYTFMWRIEGGFKDSGRQFGVDSEQFTTTTRNTLDIYALDYQVRQLTMGLGEGVPIWYAELLNRILSLSNVIIAKNDWLSVKDNVGVNGKHLVINDNGTATITNNTDMRIDKVVIPNNAVVLSAQFASPSASEFAKNVGYAFYDTNGLLVSCGVSPCPPQKAEGYEWRTLPVPIRAKYFAVTGVNTTGDGITAYNFEDVKFVVGTQMVRNEGEVPEITPIMEGTKSFIVTQNLREVKEY